jgi:hypothetical protein
MARIPEVELERLKAEISVERLVEASGIELKKGGKDLLGRCPFHEDSTASLVVTPAKNLWHCFGCGVGGGPIDWVMKLRGVSFRHAVELLREGFTSLAADSAGVKHSTVRAPVRSTVCQLAAPVAFDADDQALLNQTVGYYYERLLATPEATAHLMARGLAHPELVAHFKPGVANRTQLSISGAAYPTVVSTTSNRLTSAQYFTGTGTAPRNFSYDAAGNTTSLTSVANEALTLATATVGGTLPHCGTIASLSAVAPIHSIELAQCRF